MSDNRKYYYLKLKENFYNSETMVILESMQDGLLYSNLLLKMYLMSLKSGGILMLNDHLPHTPQTIATFTRHQVGTVERALKVFLEFGLVEILTDGAYYMADIQLLIGQSSTEGERKKKERMRLKRQKLLPSDGADICPPYSRGDICPPEIRDKRLDIRDKSIKGKITDLDRMKIEEQKKAVRSGYDMEIIPSDLATYGGEAKKILDDLQSRNERMFLVTVLFLNTAKTKQELDSAVFQTAGIAQKFNCTLNRLDYLQEQGLMSSLPLANNLVPIKRALTTTSTAIFVPFTTQELFMEGDSLYYGLNAVSNNMIMADRKQLKNPNGLILGTPGSGKSFSAKREITNVFFTTTDDIIVADPEGEYYPLVEALGGQVIHISSTSKDYINPMDINLNYADDDNPLGMKSDFILSLCELIMGARDGMEPEEKSVIDRCLPLVYQKYLNDPKPENMPTLGDLYDCLREQKERQAQRIATALEIYVNGSLRVFNHQTNVELDNRIICFDIKELGKQLKKLGMLIVQDQVWNRVTINRSGKKNTRYYIDEFHLLLKEEQTAAYSVEIWKRFRKWGGIPTGITQNIKDLLASREIENIFENSDFIYMLNQASGDRQILAKQLNISPFQLSYVTNSNEGEGLLFYGNTIIPFKDKFDTSLKLYSLMTTKPNEMGKYKEKKEA